MAKIAQIISGAYEPVVRMDDGTSKNLGAVLQEMNDEIVPAEDAVVGSFYVSEPSASSAVSSDSFAYNAGNPPSRVLYVPSLEELGYSPDDYKLDAIMIANVRASAPPEGAQLRLVDADGEAVAGSTTDATATNDTTDQVVLSEAFDITPGKGYTIDIRKTAAGVSTVTLQSKNLLVRIVKL